MDVLYSLFPRYRLAEETLIEIERLTFTEAITLDDARESLLAAGQHAYEELAREFRGKDIAVDAVTQQSIAFMELVRSLSPADLEEVEPAPYRRVLAESESARLWELLRVGWNVRGRGSGWYPLSGDTPPVGTLIFHEELWRHRCGNDLLRRFLEECGIARCFLLRELGPPDYEMEVGLVRPPYDGSESFLTTNADWILYTSHESSLTLTGRLADFVRLRWTDAAQLAYGGPFHTDDLRGSWNP